MGETLASQYIINQYQQLQLEPKGTNGYLQNFDIDEGKQANAATTFLIVNNSKAILQKDFFALAFSANATVKGSAAVALNQASNPWFKDLKDVLEENQTNPHFDIEDFIKKEADKVAGKKATALILFNTSNITDNVQFNKNDKSALTKIPVIYLTKEGYKKYFSDETATQNIQLSVSLSQKIRKSKNVIAFINNNAATTVIIGAHYDHLGYGEDKNALDTGHVIHNGADDNASGTAAVIELARMLKNSSPKNNNYLFINFSGEEL
ncbi:M28 family peptidase, partial [Thermococcus sp. M36]|nr:M28 family peptidase [Thermococcus sp. M36]